MLSWIIAGLLAIYLGAVELGSHWSMKVFWIGLIVWGIIVVFENWQIEQFRAQIRRNNG